MDQLTDALINIMLGFCTGAWGGNLFFAILLNREEARQHRNYVTAYGAVVLVLVIWMLTRLFLAIEALLEGIW